MSVWQRARFGPALIRAQGWSWVAYRLERAAARRLGFDARRTPLRAYDDRPFAAWLRPGVPTDPSAWRAWRRDQPGGRFFFVDTALPRPCDSDQAIDRAEQVLRGTWPWFSVDTIHAGFPPDWHRDPETGYRWPDRCHWSALRDDGPHDLKIVWEPSRFAAAFVLARGFAACGDMRYASAFWALVEDWALHNPPMHGPNWYCGQEAALRVMAWCFGLHALAAAADDARIARVTQWLAWHGLRIERHIRYARSQHNNHTLSEAAGLWTLGLLFPELAPAARWRTLGRSLLEDEAPRQFDDGGGYVQQSTNYARLALHTLAWSLRLGELNDVPLSRAVHDAVGRGGAFLHRVTDPDSGAVPNWGGNDGAWLLPLDAGGFHDYRATVQLSAVASSRRARLPPGPWDETVRWLYGETADVAARPPQSSPSMQSAPERISSAILLRGPASRGFLRCPIHRARPAHADALHLDLWWKGSNVAVDAGSDRYNGPAPWRNGLAGTAVHNTVAVDGLDQMLRAGRFLWLEWTRSAVLRLERSPRGDVVVCEHDGYRRVGIVHRRTIVRVDDAWLVVDDLIGTGRHRARLQWLFAGAAHAFDTDRRCLTLDYPHGRWAARIHSAREATASVVSGGTALEPTRGVVSTSYVCREPAVSLVVEVCGAAPHRLVSLLGPAPLVAGGLSSSRVELGDDPPAVVELAPIGDARVVGLA